MAYYPGNTHNDNGNGNANGTRQKRRSGQAAGSTEAGGIRRTASINRSNSQVLTRNVEADNAIKRTEVSYTGYSE